MLQSPDGRIGVQIALPTPDSAEMPRWSATFRGKEILQDCRLSLEAKGEGDLLAGVRVRNERRRALDRPGMTEQKFAALLAKQLPDAEKRRRADFVVDSSQGFDHTRAQIRDILRTVATMQRR